MQESFSPLFFYHQDTSRAWQIILNDYSIRLFPNFQPIILSNQPIIFPLFSNSTFQPQKKLIAMTCAFKLLLYLFAYMQCALESSSCPFKVGISGYGNLRTMSTDKWATSKFTQLSTKVRVKLFLTWFSQCRVSYFNKAGKFTYYSKVMPIILTLFSTIMWFLLFSNYSGNNLPRPRHQGRAEDVCTRLGCTCIIVHKICMPFSSNHFVTLLHFCIPSFLANLHTIHTGKIWLCMSYTVLVAYKALLSLALQVPLFDRNEDEIMTLRNKWLFMLTTWKPSQAK